MAEKHFSKFKSLIVQFHVKYPIFHSFQKKNIKAVITIQRKRYFLFQGNFLGIRYSFDLFTAFYLNAVSPVGFYHSVVEESRRSKRSRTIHKRTTPLTFLPRGGVDGEGKRVGGGTGGGGGRQERNGETQVGARARARRIN